MTDPHESKIDAAITAYKASAGQPETARMRLWAVVLDLIAARPPRREPEPDKVDLDSDSVSK